MLKGSLRDAYSYEVDYLEKYSIEQPVVTIQYFRKVNLC